MRSLHAILAAFALLVHGTAVAAETPWGSPPAPHYGFADLDADGDGALSRAEARFADVLARNWSYADADGNGRLARAEYDEAMAMGAELYGSGGHSLRKREVFRSLDKDGDGSLSRTEAAPRVDLARNFDAADTNGDGAVDRGEFSEVGLDLLAAGGS